MNADPLAGAVLGRQPLAGVDVVDAHAHLGAYSRFFIPDSGPAGMVRVMDRCGVRRAVLASHLAIELDARAGNDETAAAVRDHPDRLAGYIVVNPHQDPEGELARWRDDPGMVAVKIHPSLHGYPATGPRYEPVWEFAAERAVPVLSHTWTGSEYDDPALLAAVAERHPGVSFLLGHAGALRRGFDDVIAMARRTPNLYLETCGSFFTGRWLERMVAEAGADRVIYGSDFPFIDLRFALGRVVFAALPPVERRTVLGGAVRRIMPALDTKDQLP